MKTYLVHPKKRMQMNDRSTKSVNVYFIEGQEVAHAKVMYQIHFKKSPENTYIISSLTGKRYYLHRETGEEAAVKTFADHYMLDESGDNSGSNYRTPDTNSTRFHTKRATIILRSELENGEANLTISPAANTNEMSEEMKQVVERMVTERVGAVKQELSEKLVEVAEQVDRNANATADVKQEVGVLKQEFSEKLVGVAEQVDRNANATADVKQEVGVFKQEFSEKLVEVAEQVDRNTNAQQLEENIMVPPIQRTLRRTNPVTPSQRAVSTPPESLINKEQKIQRAFFNNALICKQLQGNVEAVASIAGVASKKVDAVDGKVDAVDKKVDAEIVKMEKRLEACKQEFSEKLVEVAEQVDRNTNAQQLEENIMVPPIQRTLRRTNPVTPSQRAVSTPPESLIDKEQKIQRAFFNNALICKQLQGNVEAVASIAGVASKKVDAVDGKVDAVDKKVEDVNEKISDLAKDVAYLLEFQSGDGA